jgi:ribosomal protein S18 acetylase RimI-like enzyme
MNAQLTYMIAQQRSADLQRVAARRGLDWDPVTGPRSRWHPLMRLAAARVRLTARLARAKTAETARVSPQASRVMNPNHLTSSVSPSLVLADATPLRLRPIGGDDRDRLVALFDRPSFESRRKRFLSPKRELTPGELSYFCDIDHVLHEAIVAVDQRDGSIVGVGRYARDANRAGVAELAVVVEDERQRMGIGNALAARTMLRARANGFALFTATTLWDNWPARALLRRLGFRVHAVHGSEIEYEWALNSPSAEPSVRDERVTLRLGSPADADALARLSALDSSTPPARPVLLAEVDGQLLAALAVSDGTAVANPFHRTADLIDLLRARARQLDGNHRTRRSGRLPSWSRARALAWR